uniref:Uncharacterized protein n=1 Tax=Kryptolebias marmoratus TaxID=37003 RepID=A0A3Q3B1D2_KRYMA
WATQPPMLPQSVFAESRICFVCISSSPCARMHWLTCSHHVSLRSLALPPSPATWRRMITYREVNFISMEMPGRSPDTRDTLRIPLHYLQCEICRLTQCSCKSSLGIFVLSDNQFWLRGISKANCQ